ncbi:hypothetical protein HIM_09425 [Hirsutella minnesotensis 3608]|uniref:Thioesterase family protein n=1 Tax=Hirsutella minnesotensis 3608 TaxID=1043627 RepID=A0A0F7ZLJ2_9HYPO|nr:hypothetical protein HIM_09425 [Hirsutella minnesotensis 3608]
MQSQNPSVSFRDALHVKKLDSHTYRVDLKEDCCIGAVPNGGYTSSCMLAAAGLHLASRHQPDTLTAHFEYPNRTAPGPAVVIIEDIKIGRQLSSLQLTLWQGELTDQAPWIIPSRSRRAVIALTNHTNLREFAGVTLPTGYQSLVDASLPPVPDLASLADRGSDDRWEEGHLPASAGPMKSLRNWRFFLPKEGSNQSKPGALDMWVRTASGEPITQAVLPYVADSFPFNLHTFLVAPELRALLQPPSANDPQSGNSKSARAAAAQQNEQRAGMWFPTIVMNLETKAMLPEEGVAWLAVSVTSKQIRDGHFDLEVIIRDQDGELIALSHHVAMIVAMERNTGKQGNPSKAAL